MVLTRETGAIWAGLISLRTCKLLQVGLLVAIVALALFLPPGSMEDLLTQSVLSAGPAQARVLAERSFFPLASALAYSFTMTAAPIGAIAMCFSRAYVKDLRASLVGGLSITSRVIYALGAFIFLVVPYLVEVRPLPVQKSAHVMAAVGQSRLLLAVFCTAMYLAFLGLSLWVLFEVTNLARAIVATKRT